MQGHTDARVKVGAATAHQCKAGAMAAELKRKGGLARHIHRGGTRAASARARVRGRTHKCQDKGGNGTWMQGHNISGIHVQGRICEGDTFTGEEQGARARAKAATARKCERKGEGEGARAKVHL